MTLGACLIVEQVVRAFVPALAFTLGWTHSVEKTDWQEDYRVLPAGLVITEARVSGSGAGMEPPAGAVLRSGVWHYVPPAIVHDRLRLTVSPYAEPYRLCTDGACRPLYVAARLDTPDAIVEIVPCDGALTSPPASR